MTLRVPGTVIDVLARQDGVISRFQAIGAGMPGQLIDSQLRSGRWRQLEFGVYAAFSGPAPRDSVLWAAVLRAGPDAVLSHQSAAELYGIADPARLIHVTVPVRRRVRCSTGLVIHRSARLSDARNPALLPPRTRATDTALDLAESAATLDDAFGWLCRAVGNGITTASMLRAAMQTRSRVRWRASLEVAVGDIGSGARSVLELRYVRDVERAHDLPMARRQVRTVSGSRTRYLDNLYEEPAVVVELDGQATHPAETRWRDIHRDNDHASSGLITLRYSWPDITLRPCQVARQIADVLASRSATLHPRPCTPPARDSVIVDDPQGL